VSEPLRLEEAGELFAGLQARASVGDVHARQPELGGRG